MAQTDHVIGIVRLDATPGPHASFDEHIGRTLQRLRAGPSTVFDGHSDVDSSRGCARRRIENRINRGWDDETVVLTADLRRLIRDLEAEWTKYQRVTTRHIWSSLEEMER